MSVCASREACACVKGESVCVTIGACAQGSKGAERGVCVCVSGPCVRQMKGNANTAVLTPLCHVWTYSSAVGAVGLPTGATYPSYVSMCPFLSPSLSLSISLPLSLPLLLKWRGLLQSVSKALRLQ